jgi:ribosome-interacting GTPase 1
MELDESRLGRIEDKLDRLADVIVQMARTEEKLVTLEKDRNIILERMEKLDMRVYALEASSNQSIGIGKMLSPIWSGFAGATIAIVLAYFGFKK